MRPIETLLSLTNLLTFFGLAIPQPDALFWMRYLAPIALLIAIAQALVEGPRWQMFPAYALTGLFFLVWLLRNTVLTGGPIGQILNNRLVVGLGVIGLAVSVALPIILPVFRFSHPNGPYEIGTLTYHWVDADRPEVFTADPNDRRALMVQIWYPAKADPSSPRAPYVQNADALTPALAQLGHLPAFTFEQLKYVTTNAVSSAPVADDKPNYPVLIFLE
ncbi:MAG: carboxylic ester hydrolase, partial [Chloroflexota bacterium]|nr:carboxylic ester hydrolase [Chloroflexota bacterium]